MRKRKVKAEEMMFYCRRLAKDVMKRDNVRVVGLIDKELNDIVMIDGIRTRH